MKPTPVAQMRAKIIAFLAGDKLMSKSEIKEHLKLNPLRVNSTLDKALKSVKIHFVEIHPEITRIKGKPIYLATPIRWYSLA